MFNSSIAASNPCGAAIPAPTLVAAEAGLPVSAVGNAISANSPLQQHANDAARGRGNKSPYVHMAHLLYPELITYPNLKRDVSDSVFAGFEGNILTYGFAPGETAVAALHETPQGMSWGADDATLHAFSREIEVPSPQHDLNGLYVALKGLDDLRDRVGISALKIGQIDTLGNRMLAEAASARLSPSQRETLTAMGDEFFQFKFQGGQLLDYIEKEFLKAGPIAQTISVSPRGISPSEVLGAASMPLSSVPISAVQSTPRRLSSRSPSSIYLDWEKAQNEQLRKRANNVAHGTSGKWSEWKLNGTLVNTRYDGGLDDLTSLRETVLEHVDARVVIDPSPYTAPHNVRMCFSSWQDGDMEGLRHIFQEMVRDDAISHFRDQARGLRMARHHVGAYKLILRAEQAPLNDLQKRDLRDIRSMYYDLISQGKTLVDFIEDQCPIVT